MHLLHTYIAHSLAEKLHDRHVVVWYDIRAEFTAFINELRGQPATSILPGSQVETVQIQEQSIALCCYAGSFFALRAAVEDRVQVDRPKSLLLYIPDVARDPQRSVLLELELGGETYEPQLRRLARNVLRQFHSDGVIDDLLASERLSYQDIVNLVTNAVSGEGATSVLKLIFPQARDNATLVADWLANAASDAALVDKAGVQELYKLASGRLGLMLASETPLAGARSRLLRYILVGEFRADLSSAPPLSISLIPTPTNKEQLAFLREIARSLRSRHADIYVAYADQIEDELSLASASIAAEHLGAVDTFRFEEHALLAYCGTLLAQMRHAQALAIAAERRQNFWVDRDPLRQAQWQVCQLIAELGAACDAVDAELDHVGNRPADWVAAYAHDVGWYRMDQLQRQLESWVARMDEEPVLGQALSAIRQRHDRLSQRMAERFTQALRTAGWHIDGMRAQTKIFDDLVQPRPGQTIAYILVDALRFEMGQELMRQLAPLGEHSCTPAIAALPTITKIGMAALLPGAAAGFNVLEEKGKLIARIGEFDLPDLATRQKYLRARIPHAVDLDLGELLALSKQKAEQRFKNAPLIVVRSQDIDMLGETGNTLLARQSMDTLIGNVARAVRKLAGTGVSQVIITADHGHLFALERGNDMKIESPGDKDNCVEQHRRCWVGRWGKATPGTVRVSGTDLGYATDLDFFFPTGLGVFKAGGGLVYHHGGTSMQELIVPVIQVRIPRKAVAEKADAVVLLSQVPQVLHTRTLGVTLTLTGNLFTQPMAVRPLLLAGNEQVGYAGMAHGGEFDRTTGCVTLKPAIEVSVGMLLASDNCPSLRIVVLHPATDAVLGQSEEIAVALGM
jgi:hypothetical protein